jgi:integrase
MRGVAVVAVQRILGHATLSMTMRYAHLAPGVTRAAVATLDEPAPNFADSGCSGVAVSAENAGN